ncbi:MAG: hypothetical protein ACXACC_00865 [Promethearchaeota archaeon]|jgi:hypothetical protein
MTESVILEAEDLHICTTHEHENDGKHYLYIQKNTYTIWVSIMIINKDH